MSCSCRVADLRCPELCLALFPPGRSSGAVHPQALIAAPTSVTVGCGACGDTASSWHSMTSLSRSALQVRLHRLWLRVDHLWDGGIPDLHPMYLSHLFLRSNTTTTCSRWPLPLATRRLQSPVGQSWDGGDPGLSPPVALAGV